MREGERVGENLGSKVREWKPGQREIRTVSERESVGENLSSSRLDMVHYTEGRY